MGLQHVPSTVKTQRRLLPISKRHPILAVANLLAQNNFCYVIMDK